MFEERVVRTEMLICLVPGWESQQPHVQGEIMDLSASHPVSPMMLGAGSPGTSSLCLMLQTPSHFNGPWLWYLLKYLYLKETTLQAEQVWPWSMTHLLRYYLLVADLLPAPYCSLCYSRTHLLLTPTQVVRVPTVSSW